MKIMLPGRKSGFRAGFRSDSNRESLKIASPAGHLPLAFGQQEGRFGKLTRLEYGRNPARKPDFRPGSNIGQPKIELSAVTWTSNRSSPSYEHTTWWHFSSGDPFKRRGASCPPRGPARPQKLARGPGRVLETAPIQCPTHTQSSTCVPSRTQQPAGDLLSSGSKENCGGTGKRSLYLVAVKPLRKMVIFVLAV